MIFHQATFPVGKSATFEWWAVDSNSIILALCRVEKGPKICIDVVKPVSEPVAVSSHPLASDIKKSAECILADCRQRFRHLKTCPAALSETTEAAEEIPEYILMSDALGIPEAVAHTRDPRFIAVFRLDQSFSDPREHLISYRSQVHLPEAGWEYWRTDARQEFDRLSVEYFEEVRTLAAMGPRAFQPS